MNETGLPTYLINDKDFLIVAASDIQVGHGLVLDSNYILEHLERVIKAYNFWCGDDYIINNFTPQLFLPSCQVCQLKGV